jgi:hypothetical protein
VTYRLVLLLLVVLLALPVRASAAPYRNALSLDLSRVSAAPSSVVAQANGTAVPKLSDETNQADVQTLAAALVFAKTGTTSYRDKVCRNLNIVVGTQTAARALGVGRGVQAYALAADYVNAPANCPNEAKFRSWLASMRTFATSGGPANMTVCDEVRPNNWGTHCGASRAAADIYLGDTTDLTRAATVFKGWLGDRSAYVGFKFTSPAETWGPDGATLATLTGINPPGARHAGTNVDGVLPDDQRRGGSCCALVNENYVYEALQGVTVETLLLAGQGYDVPNWSTQAVRRAFQWEYAVNAFPATGDDTWEIPFINKLYGAAFAGAGDSWGKGMGAGAWLAPGLVLPVPFR